MLYVLCLKALKTFQEHRNGALLIITHNTKILEALHVDKTHILAHGSIIKKCRSGIS